jgi:hypothetical protein
MKSIPFAKHFIRGFNAISIGAMSIQSIEVKPLLFEQYPTGWFFIGRQMDKPSLIPVPNNFWSASRDGFDKMRR